MMGRYEDGLVLSNYQVCKECNIYFDKTFEDKMGLNSYEAFLRMRHGTKKVSDGRQVRGARITIKGSSSVLNGLTLIPVADSNNPERFHFDIEPCVGIKISDDEYQYYLPDEIPDATEEVLGRLKNSMDPIIQFGCDEEKIRQILVEKGYIDQKSDYNEKCITDELKEKEFWTKINFVIDSTVKRLCAKTAFNFLCYSTSTDYVLNNAFDPIRNYIRYGTENDGYWFQAFWGYATGMKPPNKTAHAIGNMVRISNQNAELVGMLHGLEKSRT